MLSTALNSYKKAYQGLSRNSWYLSLVMLINRSGTMVIPFMTIYCTQKLHFSITQAGTIMALFGFGSVIGALVGGKVTDKFGFYDVQIFALLSGGLFFIILGFQTTFIWIAIISFVLSFCNDAFRPANSSAIAQYSSDDNKTRSYSLNRLAVNLGWAFGGGLGGFLASFNYHLLFWVDGCTNIFAALILLRLIPRSSIAKPVKHCGPVAGSSPYRDVLYLVFIGFSTIFSACFFQLFTMQPVFYKEVWHFNERFIGGLMALNGLLITFIEMVLIHNLEGKKHPLQYVALGILIVGAGFALTNIMPAGQITALIVVGFVTLGEIVSMPFMNSFWISRSADHNRGQYAAVYSSSWSVAQILAPLVGSMIINRYGFANLWWCLGAACLVSSAGILSLYRAKFKIATILST